MILASWKSGTLRILAGLIMHDPRIKLVVFLLLSVSHAVAPSYMALALVAFTILISCLHYKALLRGSWIIIISCFAMGILGIITWLYLNEATSANLIYDYMKWCSLVTVTVVLLLSLSAMEIVKTLVFFRVPYHLSLSVGVGLRFLPILHEEARRTAHYQKRRGITLSWGTLRRYGFVGFLNKTLSPILVNVLRRVDALVLSITVQQLERRIKNSVFLRIVWSDWGMLAVSSILAIICVFNAVG